MIMPESLPSSPQDYPECHPRCPHCHYLYFHTAFSPFFIYWVPTNPFQYILDFPPLLFISLYRFAYTFLEPLYAILCHVFWRSECNPLHRSRWKFERFIWFFYSSTSWLSNRCYIFRCPSTKNTANCWDHSLWKPSLPPSSGIAEKYSWPHSLYPSSSRSIFHCHFWWLSACCLEGFFCCFRWWSMYLPSG